MTKSKGKEVAVKANTEVSAELSGMFDSSLGSAGDTLDAADLRISKLTLIQQMTKTSFNTEKAPLGSYIDSIEKADMSSSIDLFVMSDVKLWEVKYLPKGKDKVEYLGTIDHHAGNKDLRDNPRIPEELAEKCTEKGIDVEMIKNGQINMINRFYVLKVEDVMNGAAFPYIVDFKRASYPAGVQLKNSFYKMKKMLNIPSYAKVFTLGSEFIQAEHEYYIKTVSSGRMIEKEEIEAVESWVREMSTNRDAYADDNSDEGEDFQTEANENVVEAELAGTTDKPKF